jgi:AbrB family looped-hinge helix DNA binding protein
MQAERPLLQVNKQGQVTIPAEMRERFGIKEGDFVAIEETSEGVLIMPRGMLALRALDEIGKILKEQGLTLEDMIESGKEIREELFRERYGHLKIDRT